MEFKDRVRKYTSDLVNEATGHDASFNEELREAYGISRDHVLSILQRARVPLDRRLVADLDQALEGEEPRLFVPADRVVERYRERHHSAIDFTESDFGGRPLGLYVDQAVESIEREASEHEQFGVSLEPYRDGAACVAEQRFFYETDEWKDRRTLMRIIDRFTCRECGRNAREEMLHAHHSEHIYTVFSRRFYHNFDVGYLRCLCESCHIAFHGSHLRGYSDFQLAKPSEVIRGRELRRTMERLHDAVRECRFCFHENRRAA